MRNAESARASAAGADGVVVGSALIDVLRANLDADGKAGPNLIKAVTDLVSDIAQGVRSAAKMAAK